MSTGRTKISFEFFPAKTDKGTEKLMAEVDQLAAVKPDYMTVTYGAGGSTRDKTLETAQAILKRTLIPTATHLTYINTTIEEMEQIAHMLWDGGIRHIVALRGDLPSDLSWPLDKDANYFQYTNDFVAKLKSLHDFEISVGAYPEKHPDAPDLSADISALKMKCDAGATRAITQFFFENHVYFEFIEQCEKAGIDVPIIPGLLPIANYEKMLSFAKTCQTTVPDSIRSRFENADESDHEKIAEDLLVEQTQGLINGGVEHIHFYTLNKAGLTLKTCETLNLGRPKSNGVSSAA